jgi:hypothetical protein
MFNLIAPLILLSTHLNEFSASSSWTGKLIAQSIPVRKERPSVIRTSEISKTKETANTIIPVSLPTNAKVWLKAGGVTTGQVKGFDVKQESLTLEEESIPLSKIEKVTFDDKALAYSPGGKPVIRGEDKAQAEPSTWQNVSLSAFQLKDPKLGQAQVNLAGILKPLELKGIRSVAKTSVYVVDEIKFQPTGTMTIKVKPANSPSKPSSTSLDTSQP